MSKQQVDSLDAKSRTPFYQRLIELIYHELVLATNDDERDLRVVAERLADRLTDGRAFLRSGRRVYDRLRERLLTRK